MMLILHRSNNPDNDNDTATPIAIVGLRSGFGLFHASLTASRARPGPPAGIKAGRPTFEVLRFSFRFIKHEHAKLANKPHKSSRP